MNMRPQTHIWENTLSKSDLLSSPEKGGVCGATSGDQNVLKHEWAGCQVQQHEYINVVQTWIDGPNVTTYTTFCLYGQLKGLKVSRDTTSLNLPSAVELVANCS